MNSSYCIKSALSPCGNFILSGSADGFGYIWMLDGVPGEKRTPLLKLEGHSPEYEVTAVAWCPADRNKVSSSSYKK